MNEKEDYWSTVVLLRVVVHVYIPRLMVHVHLMCQSSVLWPEVSAQSVCALSLVMLFCKGI